MYSLDVLKSHPIGAVLATPGAQLEAMVPWKSEDCSFTTWRM